MTANKEVAVETDLAVRRILARWCHLVDDRDYEAAAELFGEGGRFRTPNADLIGRPAVVEFLSNLPEDLFHQVSNVVVSNGSHPGTYHAVSDICVASRQDGAWTTVALGRYHDTLTGDGRDMRLEQRIVTSR